MQKKKLIYFILFLFSVVAHFEQKTISAEKAGVLAAIIFDNKHDNDDSMIDMIKDETDRTTTIPFILFTWKRWV